MVDHRMDHRNEDLWTPHEREVEGETGTSLVAGVIVVGLVLIIALVFAIFSPGDIAQQAQPVAPVTEGGQSGQ